MGYFLAIDIPDQMVAALQNYDLSMIEDARIQRREDLHITLNYLGDLSDAKYQDIENRLRHIRIPSFDVTVRGACYFGPEPNAGYRDHFFCAAVNKTDQLSALKSAIDATCLQAGIMDIRRGDYQPHITLARMGHDPDIQIVDCFFEKNRNHVLPPFHVSGFALYQSRFPEPYLKRAEFSLNK